MDVEIRPIERQEVPAWLRVLPFANGLPHWEPAPAAWHGGPEAWPPPNQPLTPAQLKARADEVLADHVHPQAAFVDGTLVGASAMLSFEITVPGFRQVPLGGVTATGVMATHRRRGLLRRMMAAMFEEAAARGEPLAGLSASEGSIYGRYGFSPATRRTRWEIERHQAALRDGSATGELELVGAQEAREVWPRLHETVRRRCVGELSAQPGQWDRLSDEPRGTDGPLRYVVHRDEAGDVDAIANYRIPWSPQPEHVGTLVVEGMCAVTAEAERALWELLLDFDLTRRVVAAQRPADEPLRWMLRNPRALRVTRQSDNLWLRVLNVPAALEMRGYDVADDLVLHIEDDRQCPSNEGSWRLQTGPNGATCERTSASPDVTVDVQALSSLYLGGMSAALLASAGRIRGRNPDGVVRLSRLLRTDPPPHNTFVF